MIKRETDYAIRTVLCLARHQAKSRSSVSTADLAAQTCVPYRFLRKIVMKLAASGIVVSRRGKGGGLALASGPEKVTLLNLIQLMEPESLVLNRCTNGPSTACSRDAFCGLHGVLASIQQELQEKLAGITLRDMAEAEATAVQQVMGPKR